MQEISDKEFKTFQEIALKLLGIKLSEAKRVLVVSRLSSRMRELKFLSFTDYLSYLGGANGNRELVAFINKITTNETYFFREDGHFKYLSEVVFPEIMARKKEARPTIRIWSSACSSGEEPYTIAITALEYFASKSGVDVKILATDVNTEVLRMASEGIYKEEGVFGKMPKTLALKYFDKYEDGLVKIKSIVKKMITFRRLNLQDERYPIKSSVDIIFCRNVMIYFDDVAKEHVLSKFHQYLDDDGTLLIGHSENLFSHSKIFKLVANTVYKKAG